jgi:ammonia channel protein AmtB
MGFNLMYPGDFSLGSWFGFNGGSVLSADPALSSFTLVTTCLAAAAGAIAVGIFSTNPDHSLGVQAIGVLVYGAVAFSAAMAIFLGVKAVMDLRVSEEEELEGLDYGEHGMHAYDFGKSSGGFETLSARPSGGTPLRAPIAASENA